MATQNALIVPFLKTCESCEHSEALVGLALSFSDQRFVIFFGRQCVYASTSQMEESLSVLKTVCHPLQALRLKEADLSCEVVVCP